ncbi:trypsin-like serine protease [Pseudohongiella acticola]|uniref:trypsin-like serine protease n=1 Tax=Pseudohongiella acticola TaxID=1524254 RepID=UPI00268D7189
MIRHDTGYTRYLASEGEYPGVFPLAQQGRRKVCVATLVAPQWALTAAHCVSETPMQAALADNDVYAVEVDRQVHDIDSVFLHPGWSGDMSGRLHSRQFDLALLHLSTPSTASVLAPYRGNSESAQAMTFLGWGYTGIGTTGTSVADGRLRFAQNTVMQADDRLRFEFNDPRNRDGRALEFEGIPGLDDSGGPALILEDGELQLAGIAIGELARTADGTGAGRYGAIVVYERVSRHLEWIESVISDN